MSDIHATRHILYVDYLALCELTGWAPMAEHRWDSLSDEHVRDELGALRTELRHLEDGYQYGEDWYGDDWRQ